MFLRNRLFLIFTASALTMACGCQMLPKKEKEAPEPPKSNTKITPEKINGDITAAAKKFQVNFFKAIAEKKRSLIGSDMIPEMQEKFSTEKFNAYADALLQSKGKLEKSEYLTSLDRGVMKVFLWKVSFEKDDKKLPDGSKATKDILFMMLIGQVDGKYMIFNWQFQ